jgi:hypothetical protein
LRGRHDGADVRQPAGRARVAQIPDQGREAQAQRIALRLVLDLRRAGVGGPHQDEDSGPRGARLRDERLERIAPEQRIDRHGVGAEPLDRTPGTRSRPEEALRIRGRRVRHVAALRVRDRHHTRLTGGRGCCGQRLPARRAQALEASNLQLDGHARGRGCLDERSAVCGHRAAGTLGGGAAAGLSERLREQLRGVWIEPGDDLALLGGHRRRKPLREPARRHLVPRAGVISSPGADEARAGVRRHAPRRPTVEGAFEEEAQPPLTSFFSADPAVNRGTRPPGIVMRSLVCGLTP